MNDAQKALAMIERARAMGRAVVVSISRPGTEGEYNIETGLIEGGSDPVTYTAFGVKIGYEQADIDGTMIQRGDQRVYVPASGFTRPDTNEQITVGGKVCIVAGVEVVAPGDIEVLYVVQVRGGE